MQTETLRQWSCQFRCGSTRRLMVEWWTGGIDVLVDHVINEAPRTWSFIDYMIHQNINPMWSVCVSRWDLIHRQMSGDWWACCRPGWLLPSGRDRVWVWSRTAAGSECCLGLQSARGGQFLCSGEVSGPVVLGLCGDSFWSPAVSGPGLKVTRLGPEPSWSQWMKISFNSVTSWRWR